MLTLHEEIAGELATGGDPIELTPSEADGLGMPAGRYEFVTEHEVSEHRWYTKKLIVVRHDGELLGFYYLKPASEIQEDQDRFEADPVPTFAVVSREVTTTVYEEAK